MEGSEESISSGAVLGRFSTDEANRIRQMNFRTTSQLVLTAAIISLVFWYSFDWWVYIDEDPEPIRKFELPLAIQIPVSTAVGIACSGLLAAFMCVVKKKGIGLGRRNPITRFGSKGHEPHT